MKITVLSELLAIKRSLDINNKCIFISITCPNEPNIIFANNPNILGIFRMKFNDLEIDTENLPAPVQSDFDGLKNFIDAFKDEVSEVVIHCGAGASRSPGVGVAVCEYLKDYNTEKSLEKYIKYNYNKKVCSLTKNELGIGKNENFYENLFAQNDEEIKL